MNAFLEKHGVDVGQVSSILLWSATVDRVLIMITAIVVNGTINIRIDALLTAFLAIAMWEKRNWARITLVVILSTVSALVLLGMVAAPFLPLQKLTIFGQPYSKALYVKMWILIVLCLPLSLSCILALVAPKTRSEFTKRNPPNEMPEPTAPGGRCSS
jgi:hypothetical protein